MLLRHIRRQTVTKILYYCRRAGWPETERHNVRRTIIILIRILLRVLMERFMPPDTTTPSSSR
jgi:hypothetical protein